MKYISEAQKVAFLRAKYEAYAMSRPTEVHRNTKTGEYFSACVGYHSNDSYLVNTVFPK